MKRKNLLLIMTIALVLSGCGNNASEEFDAKEKDATTEITTEQNFVMETAKDATEEYANVPTNELTDECTNEPVSAPANNAEVPNSVEMSEEELLNMFIEGEIAANYTEDGREVFYITDLSMDEEDALSYSIGDRVDLDNDGEKELIINGAYGGIYLDAREGLIYVLDEGWGTAGMLSYTEYDGQTWIVHSDVTHGGRDIYDFTLYDGTGQVVDAFQLNKEFWETPDEPDGPGTVYTYRDEQITKEEYDVLKEKMLGEPDSFSMQDEEETGISWI